MKNLFLFFCMSLIMAHAFANTKSKGNKKLGTIHEEIMLKYPTVKHINTDAFKALDPETTLVFDVREAGEYQVSHLKDALQIDPDTQLVDFLDIYANAVKNKTVVFYCSVGERSSRLAEMLKEKLETLNVKASFNLAGGLFQWHNEKQQLMQEHTETQFIHPYNRYWGRLIDDKNTISYEPEKNHNK